MPTQTIDTFSENTLPWIKNPFKLWNLEDMLRVSAGTYISIGETFAIIRSMMEHATFPRNAEEEKILRDYILFLKTKCSEIELGISSGMLERSAEDLPQTERELQVIANVIHNEISSHLFFFVPPHRAKYYGTPDSVYGHFEGLLSGIDTEILSACNCYAFGEYTACVFHCMRAAEIGLRALASYFEINFTFPLELADWQEMINQIEKKIKLKQQESKGVTKDKELTFYSEAVLRFSYIKESCRKHVSHARETYNESQALGIMERTQEFLKSLENELPKPHKEEVVT